MSSLLTRFEEISTPSADGYCGLFLNDKDYLVARDSRSSPVFFIRHHEAPRRGKNLFYDLEGIEAVLDFRAEVLVDDESLVGDFAVLRCTSSEGNSQRYFLELCEMLSKLIGEAPTRARIEEGINTLVRMFALRASAPKNTVIGLVGELLFIDQHKNASVCIGSWHRRPNDMYDFAFSNFGIEVKSTSRKSRFHKLTYEQARGLAGKEVYALSIRITELTNGLSGMELLQRVLEQNVLDLSTGIMLWEMVSETLGSDVDKFADFRFSYEAAVSSMTFYNMQDIPAVRGELPTGVTDVTFVSNFELVNPISDLTRYELLCASS